MREVVKGCRLESFTPLRTAYQGNAHCHDLAYVSTIQSISWRSSTMLQISIEIHMARKSTNRPKLHRPSPENVPKTAEYHHSILAPGRRHVNQRDRKLDTQHVPKPTTYTPGASTSFRFEREYLPPAASARDLLYSSYQQASRSSDAQLIRCIPASSLVPIASQPESNVTAPLPRLPLSGSNANKLFVVPKSLSDTTTSDVRPRPGASTIPRMDNLQVHDDRKSPLGHAKIDRVLSHVPLFAALIKLSLVQDRS
jgi:hypothetical protein